MDRGNLKYLPDVKSHTTAFFIQEKLDFDRIYLDAGYRTEQVKHEVQAQNFKLSRNAVNTVLQDQNFDLNSFSLGTGMYVTNFLELKAKYTESERAPEINELYSSNPHY
ncbi:TonB-dependent receptor [Acinetobacter towneri]|uniref:TonB-dependent receptor domain-containing protein n=1 Tax=Acinetobacter towneri TaxID=202956 RepID=UPI00188DAD41|nr:TonB-dependent receptor [Acinetobacter towneri]MBF4520405.1 TonB-dependent receptor [Acinetobacter towneri]